MKTAHDAADDVDDSLLLVITFEQLPPHAVYGLALLVHHVVVFEDVFTRGKMLGFYGLLGGRDARGNQFRFDRHVFFHAETQHQVLHAVPAEDAQ